MLSLAFIELYNNAARGWNNLKFGVSSLKDEPGLDTAVQTLKSVEDDIRQFLGRELKTEQDFRDVGLEPNALPVVLDPKSGNVSGFLIIKDGKFTADSVFGSDRRFSCGTFKKGMDHRYEGPWRCCGKCAERIYKGVLAWFGDDRVVTSDLTLDTEDYADYLGGEDEDYEMHCYYCKARLPVKSA